MFCNNLLTFYTDFTKSARVFLLIIEFISNLPRDMKPKLARKGRNYPVYGDNVTPLLAHSYSNH